MAMFPVAARWQPPDTGQSAEIADGDLQTVSDQTASQFGTHIPQTDKADMHDSRNLTVTDE